MMSRDEYILCNVMIIIIIMNTDAMPGVWITINLMMYVDSTADSTDCRVKHKLHWYTVCYTLKGSMTSKVIPDPRIVFV